MQARIKGAELKTRRQPDDVQDSNSSDEALTKSVPLLTSHSDTSPLKAFAEENIDLCGGNDVLNQPFVR